MEYILEDNIYDSVKQCYEEDLELASKYHILSGNNIEECVLDTVSVLNEPGHKFYRVYDNNEFIGYFGSNKKVIPYLTTFFIRLKHRNKDTLVNFWNMIENYFNNDIFATGIFDKNTRAKRYLERNGGIIIRVIPQYRNDKGLIYAFNMGV